MRDIEGSIGRYHLAMDMADRQEPVIAKAGTERLQDKTVALKEQMRSLKEIEVQLNALIWRFSTVERGLKLSKYSRSNCQQCALKENCTQGPQRRVGGSEFPCSRRG
jgi:hypothetical protein